MRFMSMVKSPEGLPPSPELMATIGKLAKDMAEAGVLVEMGGLAPSAKGTRIRLSGGILTVVDGPFVETKEVVGGFAMFNVASKAEAVELGRRFMQVHADIMGPSHVMEVEIREMYEPPAGPA
jgi:hypothetical protein